MMHIYLILVFSFLVFSCDESDFGLSDDSSSQLNKESEKLYNGFQQGQVLLP